MKRFDPIIVTRRLVLRPPTEADLHDIVAAINDVHVAAMLARVPLPYGRSDAKNCLALARGKRLVGASTASLH